MISAGYIAIVGIFIFYYMLVLFIEKKILSEPKTIITRFLSVILLYAGIGIIWYSFTGTPMLGDSQENYNLYIFIIGFVAILLTVPDLLSEFSFFKRFLVKHKTKNLELVKKELEGDAA
jgi:divalent metal cation (Fe/Co/Zn/Cd) transporter